MKPLVAIALMMAVAGAVLAHAKDKKQPNVPATFNQAHTVYVEAVSGQQFDRNLDPEDREAIADVQDALQAWKRYRLVTQREDADIVIVVRRGSRTNPDGGLGSIDNPNRNTNPNTVPNGLPNRGMDPNAPPMPGQRTSGPDIAPDMQTGASEDVFEVCQVNANGKLTRPLWNRTMENGLRGSRLLLFEQFKDAVEKVYPSQPADQGSKQ